MQIREEVAFTKGRINVRGKLVSRGKAKRADYILYFKPNIPIAIVEAKDNSHSVGRWHAASSRLRRHTEHPFVFSSNGAGFVFHDRTGIGTEKEANLTLDQFPSPAELWAKYRTWKGLTPEEEQIVLQDYFDDGSGKEPRYYQRTLSTQLLRRSPKAGIVYFSLWPQARARHTLPFRLFGDCGRRDAKSASFFSLTVTSLLTRPWSTISVRSDGRWRSSAPARRPSSAKTALKLAHDGDR